MTILSSFDDITNAIVSTNSFTNSNPHRTFSDSKLTIQLSWLSVTYRHKTARKNFELFLDFCKTIDVCILNNNYDDSTAVIKTVNGIKFFSNRYGQAMIIIPQKTLESLTENEIFSYLTAAAAIPQAKFSRLDAAIDDLSGNITLARLRKADKNNWIISKCKTVANNREKNRVGRKLVKDTIYFGGIKNDFSLCAYDKQLQQQADYSWVRLEARYKHQTADQIARLLLNLPITEWGPALARKFLDRFDIKKPTGKDSNRSRWQQPPYWKRVADMAGNIKLMTPTIKQDKTLLEQFNWFKKSMGPLLAELADNYGMAAIEAIIADGRKRNRKKLPIKLVKAS